MSPSGSTLILPIFPLPDVTFFPHTLLPLHVFEARYRAMVMDALARDRRLAVVKLRPGYEATYAGKPPVHPVAGAGEIVSWERLATGRYNILLKGECRVRIERERPSDTLYRVVTVGRLDDVPPAEDVASVLGRIREACGRLLKALDRPADLLDTALADHRARHGHEPHFDEPTPLGTEHGQLALLVGRRRGDDPLEHARLGHGPRTERDDDVAVLQTRARSRPPFDDLDDQDAEPLANPVAGRDLLHLLLREVADPHTEP